MGVVTPDPVDKQEEDILIHQSDLTNDHQPREVFRPPRVAEYVTFVEDPPSIKFTREIKDFSRILETMKCYSFTIGGFKWQVVIYPKGNHVDYLSMYLVVEDAPSLPYGWSIPVRFGLGVINQINDKYSIRNDTQHQFNARKCVLGCPWLMPLSELYNPVRGFLVNDRLVIEAEVTVLEGTDYFAYDSKKETGYVGLKNQGATGDMNSFLQILYHIPYFRKAVYHMATTEDDVPTASIPLALQSLFYKLQYSDSSVATKELTKSFGWSIQDSSMEHDVQVLSMHLREILEDKMEGTVVGGTIQQLFEGHLECVNVDYESTRKESFYDLQLDVKGCKDVYASFDKQYGMQDAKQGVLFIDFPPVLQLHLKRLEFESELKTTVKINDRYEIPLQLDLDQENGKYLSPDANRSVRNQYTLHSVLVHRGGVSFGHYYAFIRPTLSDQWYKFDDDRVTKEDVNRVLEGSIGGEEGIVSDLSAFDGQYTDTHFSFKLTKYLTAYMLVYIRDTDKDKIMCDVGEKDIAQHLLERLKKEQEEKYRKKKEKAEPNLHTIIKIARDEDLKEQVGRVIHFDLVDHEKPTSFRILKQTTFNVFKDEVAEKFGVPVQFQRFWRWALRENHTYRPYRPLSPREETLPVGQLSEEINKVYNAELMLFLEVQSGPDSLPIAPPEKSEDDILLFFKLYDPEKEELRYVGSLFVNGTGKPNEVLMDLNRMAGYSPDEEIDLYEEINFEPYVMCEPINKNSTFLSCQLEDGDIICFQKSSTVREFRYPKVPLFLDYVRNRQVVRLRRLENSKKDDSDLYVEMLMWYTYDNVVEKVAEKLQLSDPSKLRLTSHNCYSQQPKSQPIKYQGVEYLFDMLAHYNQTCDILYYEILTTPLPELEGFKTLKVVFHRATKDQVVTHTIRLPKQSTVADVISDLKTKVELSHPEAELRLLEVFYHKIYRIFPSSEKIENIKDQYWTLRGEEIPEEEKYIDPNNCLIRVCHFTRDAAQNQMPIQYFGEPFFLVIREGETLSEIKGRIQKKLQVPDEEFSKWKFAFLSSGHPEYLQDNAILYDRFQRGDVYGAWVQYLGLDHSENAPQKGDTTDQVSKSEEQCISFRDKSHKNTLNLSPFSLDCSGFKFYQNFQNFSLYFGNK